MSPLLYFLLCNLFLHACNARCLGLLHNDHTLKPSLTTTHQENIDREDGDLYQSTSTWPNDSMEDRAVVVHDASTKKNDLEAFLTEETSTRATSGNNVMVYSKIDMRQQEDKNLLQDVNKRAGGRSILSNSGSKEDHTDQESVDDDQSKGLITEEEENIVVVMDYAQPHRKPPIHNQKP